MNDAIHVEPHGIGPPIRLARIFKDASGAPKIDRITGSDYDRIQDTARSWMEIEQESLRGLEQTGSTAPNNSAPVAPPGADSQSLSAADGEAVRGPDDEKRLAERSTEFLLLLESIDERIKNLARL